MPAYGSSNSIVRSVSVLVIFAVAFPWKVVKCGLNWLPRNAGYGPAR